MVQTDARCWCGVKPVFLGGWGWVSRPHCPSRSLRSCSCGSCKRSQPCSPVDGFCLACQPGWNGTLCQEPCAPGFHGEGCLQPCPRCRRGEVCDPETGSCPHCEPGWTGPRYVWGEPSAPHGDPSSRVPWAEALLSVLAAATAPAPWAPSARDASKSAPSALRGAATLCPEFVYARRATGEPGGLLGRQVTLGAGQGQGPPYPGTLPSFHLSSSCNDTCPEGYFGVNCSSPCQCSRGTCHPAQGHCVLSKSNLKLHSRHRARG